MSVPVIPPAEPRCPDCSVCGRELVAEDDAFYCEECGLGWPMRNFHLEPGRRLDEDTPICGAEVSPFAGVLPHRYRCIRDTGHDSEHAGVLVGPSDPFNASHTWRNVRPERPGGAA
jgi:hypothetical protein